MNRVIPILDMLVIWRAFPPSVCFTEYSCRENFPSLKGNLVISSQKIKSNVL